MMNYLVTGANRGLGLEFVKQLSRTSRVFATARNVSAATELKELQRESGGNIKIVPMDVSDNDSVVEAKQIVAASLLGGGERLDCVINNAGAFAFPCATN
ncbi:MAG: hypothetical protein MHM6MM_004129 [Cercozoa sp. M6MM]